MLAREPVLRFRGLLRRMANSVPFRSSRLTATWTECRAKLDHPGVGCDLRQASGKKADVHVRRRDYRVGSRLCQHRVRNMGLLSPVGTVF